MRLIPFLRSSGFGLTQTISADTSNYNLRTAALAAGWDGAAPLIANITIDSGIVVDSTSTSTYAFDVGTTAYPDGSSLALTSLGYIVGMGGAGASITGYGFPGGPALRIIASLPATINNASGTIGGGGGGGGASGSRGGGGGRSGRTNSAGGSGMYGSGGAGTFTSGGKGGSTGGGAGGTTGPGADASGNGGGGGGGWGASGGSASSYSGGGGGAAVVGNDYITWTNTGLRYGSIT